MRKNIFIFIDSLGYEILNRQSFLDDIIKLRLPLKTPLGYSSAAVPTILSGQQPSIHGHWSFFYYSPHSSPFRYLRYLSALPRMITDRGRVRRYLSKGVQKILGYTGYFQLYNAPLEHLHFFDYCEKRDIFLPGGLNQGRGIFDVLFDNGIPYHVSNWRRSDKENIELALTDIEKENMGFAFIYLSELDGLLHSYGTKHLKIKEKIYWYEQKLYELFEIAKRNGQVEIFVFSDHGQADVHKTLDLMASIENLGLKFGEDYVAFYDSTIARFWFLNPQAEKIIRNLLSTLNDGNILDEEELKALGVYWPDGKFGQLMFLVNPGILIVPSHMGKKAMAGMHGYHPEDPSADGIFLSNQILDKNPKHLTDLFPLMVRQATKSESIEV